MCGGDHRSVHTSVRSMVETVAHDDSQPFDALSITRLMYGLYLHPRQLCAVDHTLIIMSKFKQKFLFA